MQGRLSVAPPGRAQAFPWERWPDEFAAAAACGFARIEWLVTSERFGDNPILDARGQCDIRAVIAASGVEVASLCADCFVTDPVLRVGDADQRRAEERLVRLISAGAAIGVRVVIVPVLEGGAIQDDADEDALLTLLSEPLREAARHDVRLAIESDLPAKRLRTLLRRSAGLMACYDIGNAAASGQDAVEDLPLLGELVAAVHVKDRRHNGGSVALGQGDADLDGALSVLSAMGFHGPLTLETPAGVDPVAAAERNLAFATSRLPLSAVR